MRTKFLDVLNGQSTTDQPPVWLMRQAGRYLPEYRQIRSKFQQFLDLCRHPEACCEVALQPLDRFDLDAAILFSDILTIPEAMGVDVRFVKGQGPVIDHPVRTEKAIEALSDQGIEDKLAYVMQAVTTTKLAVKDRVPLIGFSGSPWTLAAYMVEGQGSKQFNQLRKLMYQAPKLMHQLLTKLANSVSQYLIGQCRAGAQALMLFDTWGGLLSPETYRHFSLAYMKQIAEQVKQAYPHVPIVFFTKNGGLWLSDMMQTPCDGIGLDWTMDIKQAKAIVQTDKVIQGNLDPAALYGDHDAIAQQVKQIVQDYGQGRRHIFNLGHGIYPDIDPDKVKTMVQAVRESAA